MLTKEDILKTINEAKEIHKLYTENADLMQEYKEAKAILAHYNDAKPIAEPSTAENEITTKQIADSLNKANTQNKTEEITTSDIYKKLGIK